MKNPPSPTEFSNYFKTCPTHNIELQTKLKNDKKGFKIFCPKFRSGLWSCFNFEFKSKFHTHESFLTLLIDNKYSYISDLNDFGQFNNKEYKLIFNISLSSRSSSKSFNFNLEDLISFIYDEKFRTKYLILL